MGAVCWMAGAVAVCAQDYYDITAEFLQNAAFDQHIDVTNSDTGDKTDMQCDVDCWDYFNTKDAYILVGVFQYGTAATFCGAAVPTVDPDGAAGSGLAILPKQSVSGYLMQNVTLLPGSYKVVVTMWNASEEETLRGQNAWVPTRGRRTQSTL